MPMRRLKGPIAHARGPAKAFQVRALGKLVAGEWRFFAIIYPVCYKQASVLAC